MAKNKNYKNSLLRLQKCGLLGDRRVGQAGSFTFDAILKMLMTYEEYSRGIILRGMNLVQHPTTFI